MITRSQPAHGQFLSGVVAASMQQDSHVLTDRQQVLARQFLATGSDEARGNHDAYGGHMVPESFATDLLTRAFDFSRVAGRCRNFLVEGSTLKMPFFRETSRADGSRLGGVRSYWHNETVQITSSQPTWNQLVLRPKTLVVLIPATEELVFDAPALEQTLLAAGSEEIGVRVDDTIISGTGIGEPEGILTAAATISVTKQTGQAAATILQDNITDMLKRVWPYSLPNAVFYCSNSAFAHIIANIPNLVRFAETDSPQGAATATLAGLPLIVLEQCKPLGTVGDLILCDPSQYILGDKGTPEMIRSIGFRYIYHESMFKIVYRVDGAPCWAGAVTAKGESFTVSPFVTLETRS